MGKGYFFVVMLTAFASGSYIENFSTFCNGPDVADPTTLAVDAADCKAECDRHAGCVNAMYTSTSGYCYMRGQCESKESLDGYDLYQKQDAVVSQCYWVGVPGTVGAEYVGTWSTTASGYTCNDWDYLYYADFEDNYCRNPDGDSRLWCYADLPYDHWEYCDVPTCNTYSAGYEVLANSSCQLNNIEAHSDVPAADCQQFCDSKWNCVAVVITSTGCYVESVCSVTSHEGPTLYMRMDFPGWSSNLNMECSGNTIAEHTVDTPYSCVQKCVENENCSGVTLQLGGACQLKSLCTNLTASNNGWHTYRILDRQVSGYNLLASVSIHTYDVEQGLQNGDSYSVTQVWQCAAWCRRYGPECACFEVKQSLYSGDLNCFIKTECDINNFVGAQADIYVPAEFPIIGAIKESNTWCPGSDIASEYTPVPTAGECLSLCKHKDDCLNAVYDFYRKVCYLKSECHNTETSMHHDLYQKEGHWSEWSELGCGDTVKGQVWKQRQCENGAYCVGETTTYDRQCENYFDSSPGWRLSAYIVHSEAVTSLTSCLSLCLHNCQCNAVNYRRNWLTDKFGCELTEIPEGLDISEQLTYAPDFVHLAIRR